MNFKIPILTIITLLFSTVGTFCQKLVLINSVNRKFYPNAESIILCMRENMNLPQLKEVYKSRGVACYNNPIKNLIIGTDENAFICVIRYLLQWGEIYNPPITDNMTALEGRPKTLFEIYSILEDGSICLLASIQTGKTKEERSLFNQNFLKGFESFASGELKEFVTEYRKNVIAFEANDK